MGLFRRKKVDLVTVEENIKVKIISPGLEYIIDTVCPCCKKQSNRVRYTKEDIENIFNKNKNIFEIDDEVISYIEDGSWIIELPKYKLQEIRKIIKMKHMGGGKIKFEVDPYEVGGRLWK